jgi:hypothetical protein
MLNSFLLFPSSSAHFLHKPHFLQLASTHMIYFPSAFTRRLSVFCLLCSALLSFCVLPSLAAFGHPFAHPTALLPVSSLISLIFGRCSESDLPDYPLPRTVRNSSLSSLPSIAIALCKYHLLVSLPSFRTRLNLFVH